jgi:hypothetical protein
VNNLAPLVVAIVAVIAVLNMYCHIFGIAQNTIASLPYSRLVPAPEFFDTKNFNIVAFFYCVMRFLYRNSSLLGCAIVGILLCLGGFMLGAWYVVDIMCADGLKLSF